MNTHEEARLKLLLVSDFNVATLAQLLNADNQRPVCAATAAPFGQVFGPLMETKGGDFAVLWTTPEKTSSTFGRALRFETVSEKEMLGEVCAYADRVKAATANFKAVFAVNWTLSPCFRGYGVTDLGRNGIRTWLMKMNLKLAEELQSTAGVYILDAQKWTAALGKTSYSPKLWYLVKTPFHPDVFKEAVSDIKAAISGLMGNSRKLIALDLDNTLWGGTVGDLGWQNVRVGGHDHIGEAFLDFQRALKALANKGILLAMVSKNEESVALEALEKHPEMALRAGDFVGWKINWRDKAANLVELASELKIGLQSIVFIDDNPVERARVREALLEVFVPEWPADVTLFSNYLLQMNCFDSAYSTAEDASRTELYAAEREREKLKTVNASHEGWLRSLNTEVLVEDLTEANRIRLVQLLNKTNQMNLRTRRMTEKELLDWIAGGNRKLWAFRVKDRFGDSGITGVMTLEIEGESSEIVDFVLSCRVMGRDIERVMVAVGAEYCRSLNVRKLRAEYVPTAKNIPCLNFWNNSGFECADGGNVFIWSLDKAYSYPSGVKITFLTGDFVAASFAQPVSQSWAVQPN